MSVAVEVMPMTVAEAEAITEKIKAGLATVHEDLVRAHDRKAWKALGYSSWGDYLRDHFNVGRSRGYQLLAHARFIAELGPSTNVDIEALPEGLTRKLTGWVDELQLRLAMQSRAPEESVGAFTRRVAECLVKDIAVAPPVVEPPTTVRSLVRLMGFRVADLEAVDAWLDQLVQP